MIAVLENSNEGWGRWPQTVRRRPMQMGELDALVQPGRRREDDPIRSVVQGMRGAALAAGRHSPLDVPRSERGRAHEMEARWLLGEGWLRGLALAYKNEGRPIIGVGVALLHFELGRSQRGGPSLPVA